MRSKYDDLFVKVVDGIYNATKHEKMEETRNHERKIIAGFLMNTPYWKLKEMYKELGGETNKKRPATRIERERQETEETIAFIRKVDEKYDD